MKFNKSILAAAALSVGLFSCADEFQDMNQDPSAITKANISYLFAQSVNKFEPSGYLLWYYNAPMTYSWSQMGVPTGGMTTGILTTTNVGDQGSKFIDVLTYVREIEHAISQLPEEEQALNAAYQHAAQVLTIYLGLFDSDMFGDLPYNESCRAKFGGTLTPAYDRMESLYAQWLQELNAAIAVFTGGNAKINPSQDVVCGGKLDKWAKFANSLKLRLAVRYMASDMAKAKSIVSEVKSASCGYIDSLDDAIIFNKGTNFSNGGTGNDWSYHWSNGFLDGTAATENVINLMVDNLDPRVRFCYSKNSWNSKIVQAYYDRGKEIPAFIEEDVEFEVVDGKKVFKAWKGAGEPWVRYKGFPMEYNSMTMSKYDWYYRAGNFKIAKADGSGEKSYQTFSQFQQMMVIGRSYNPSVPTTPEDVVSIASKDRPWYGLYLGGAEVNLYLAEFAMIEGNEAAAETYYNKALALSVQEYDKLAGLNQIEYYGTTYGYDPNEKAIDLVDGEIDAMMASEAYKFTGTRDEKMEKIYVQQLLNFTLYPNEQFITARRSGYPKIGSSLLPRLEYADIPVTTVPRRFDTGLPVETDLMYQNYLDNYAAQGFTPTSNGAGHSATLHNERVWADKNAPEWGAGHNW
jgi:hypothetical protein